MPKLDDSSYAGLAPIEVPGSSRLAVERLRGFTLGIALSAALRPRLEAAERGTRNSPLPTLLISLKEVVQSQVDFALMLPVRQLIGVGHDRGVNPVDVT